METIDQSIDINADIRTVYNQWTQFEDFPEFMEGIEEVRQIDDKRLHWVASLAGRKVEWDAEIYEQVPDEKIGWRTIGGRRNDGLITFDKTGDDQTRVHLQMVYEPEGAMEKTADALGVLSARVKGDLKRFKDFVESRRHATGGWRGEIHGSRVDRESGETVRSKRLHNQTERSRPGPGKIV